METYATANSGTHSLLMGYVLWVFGFTGAHRFYFGKPFTGTIWFCTFGLLGIGWFIDLFLIPSMNRQADRRFLPGPYDYSIAWILLTFFGVLGLHRLYLGKIITGLFFMAVGFSIVPLHFITAPLIAVCLLYDFFTLNDQVSERNTPFQITN